MSNEPLDPADVVARHHQNAKHPQRCAACLMSWPCRMYQLAELAQDQAAALDRVKALANESRYRNSCSAEWSEILAALAGEQS